MPPPYARPPAVPHDALDRQRPTVDEATTRWWATLYGLTALGVVVLLGCVAGAALIEPMAVRVVAVMGVLSGALLLSLPLRKHHRRAVARTFCTVHQAGPGHGCRSPRGGPCRSRLDLAVGTRWVLADTSNVYDADGVIYAARHGTRRNAPVVLLAAGRLREGAAEAGDYLIYQPDRAETRYPFFPVDGTLRDLARARALVLMCRGSAALSTLRGDEYLAAVTAWALAPSKADALRELSLTLTIAQGKSGMNVWSLFGVGTTPPLPNGCYQVAGVCEPYPGAWPRDALLDALRHDDLTELWPHLEAARPTSAKGGTP